MENAVGYAVSGIKCDVQGCDYRDDTVRLLDYEKWLNKPCPKCGGNLLTEADLRLTKTMCAAADWINALGIPEARGGSKIKVRMHMDGSGIPKPEIIRLSDSKAESTT